MKRIIVGITGATGASIGFRVIEVLNQLGIETHVIVSRWGLQTLAQEMDLCLDDIRACAHTMYPSGDMGAKISSGSFHVDGMFIVPCSMRSLAAISSGLGDNLIHRAADVALKERRKLVLVPRETPLSTIHLEHMLKLTRMGVVMMPPNPAYYAHPSSLKDIIDQFVGRMLDQMGINSPQVERWGGLKKMSAKVVSLDSGD